jgi:hypothetical protein
MVHVSFKVDLCVYSQAGVSSVSFVMEEIVSLHDT